MSLSTEQRLSSNIRKMVLDGSSVFEKQYVTNDWDDDPQLILDRAKREVELLHMISASGLFGESLGVVKIAAADPTTATIATFEIEGRSLEQCILNDKRIRTNMTPWFLAGRWLRQFQALSLDENASKPVSKHDPTDIVDYCDHRLSSMAEYGSDWPSQSTRQQLLHQVAILRDQCEHRPKVWVHADYAPGNLMWDGNTLTPIDFAMVRSGTPLDDATYLIHRIEMHRVYRPWRYILTESIRDSILQGLGQPEAAKSPAYKLLMVKHLICRLHTYVRRPPSSIKQALHDNWVRFVLRRRLSQSIAIR